MAHTEGLSDACKASAAGFDFPVCLQGEPDIGVSARLLTAVRVTALSVRIARSPLILPLVVVSGKIPLCGATEAHLATNQGVASSNLARETVIVADLVMRRPVKADHAGSNPVDHPNLPVWWI